MIATSNDTPQIVIIWGFAKVHYGAIHNAETIWFTPEGVDRGPLGIVEHGGENAATLDTSALLSARLHAAVQGGPPPLESLPSESRAAIWEGGALITFATPQFICNVAVQENGREYDVRSWGTKAYFPPAEFFSSLATGRDRSGRIHRGSHGCASSTRT